MPHAVVGSDFAEKEVGELTDEIYGAPVKVMF